VLSLADAAVLVAARGRLMQDLDPGGVMVSVAARPERVEGLGADIAAINGPESTVISGPADVVLPIMDELVEQGVRCRRLKVSGAFHSVLMEPMLDAFRRVVRGLTFQRPEVEFAGEVWDPEYWVRHVRDTVRFTDTVEQLAKAGVTTFVEIGPDAVLSGLGPAIVDDATFVATVRRDHEEALLPAVAALWVRGVPVDWSALVGTGGPPLDLPTYAFQRQRFWLESGGGGADPADLGLSRLTHPLLGAMTEAPATGGVLFVSRWSARSLPWLSDHAAGGVVLVPGAAFAELALRVGDEVGCPMVAELLIEAPMTLPGRGGLQIRAEAGPPGPDGHRDLAIHSRPEKAGPGTQWTRHVTARLEPDAGTADFDLVTWPPHAASPVPDVTDRVYADLSEAGYGYGPAFRGLRAAWIRGDDVYAEVALPEEAGPADRYGLHPALLDAVLHAASLRPRPDGEAAGLRLPFAWTDVRLFATGATTLRVHLTAEGPDATGIRLADAAGAPVASVEALTSRAVDPAALDAGTPAGDHLFRVVWQRTSVKRRGADLHVAPVATADDVRALAELGDVPEVLLLDVVGDDPAGGAEVRELAERVLEVIQAWQDRPALQNSRLLAVTHGAVAVDGDLDDLAAAAVGGLLRSAHAENPGRMLLVDTDDSAASQRVLADVLATREPQVALREGVLSVPRLTRIGAVGGEARPWNPDGTVLVTGGTGALGSMIARHVVRTYGIRNLILVSRRGSAAPGAGNLVDELTGMGARVRLEAADVADRTACAGLLASIPAEAPLTAVVHTAGVVDDGVLASMTPERLDAVFLPKVDAAVVLDELTADLDLAAFVLYSSAAGTLGNPGQANYAAANAFLDGLAQRRRAAGRPATSLAWGWWGDSSTIGDHLSEADRQRIDRLGILAFTEPEGNAAFDLALRAGDPVLVPAKFDFAAMQALADEGHVPALLRGMLRVGRRAAGTEVADAGRLVRELAEAPPEQRGEIVLRLVQLEAAAILGHTDASEFSPETVLFDVGYDSLTAVELRNRLSLLTGLRLPPSFAFDFPTVQLIVEQLTVLMDQPDE
jgi:acyl transferase domain-containing protein